MRGEIPGAGHAINQQGCGWMCFTYHLGRVGSMLLPSLDNSYATAPRDALCTHTAVCNPDSSTVASAMAFEGRDQRAFFFSFFLRSPASLSESYRTRTSLFPEKVLRGTKHFFALFSNPVYNDRPDPNRTSRWPCLRGWRTRTLQHRHRQHQALPLPVLAPRLLWLEARECAESATYTRTAAEGFTLETCCRS